MVLLNMVTIDTAACQPPVTYDAVHCHNTSKVCCKQDLMQVVHVHRLVQLLMRLQAEFAASSCDVPVHWSHCSLAADWL